jgi:hypothetical protein
MRAIAPQLAAIAGLTQTFTGTTEEFIRGPFKQAQIQLLRSDARHLARIILTEGRSFPDLTEFFYRGVVQRGLDTLRGVVAEFKDVERYHRMADDELLTLDDVKDLTAQFVAAYPHWETVVAHVGGAQAGENESSALAASRPLENYGSPLRAGGESVTVARRPRATEPAALGEPVDDLPWQEALASALLLFRRYEKGVAGADLPLEWTARIRRLREIYDHYAARLDEVPPFLWARLFRDALLVPHSAPYRAVSELLAGGAAGVDELAATFEVDADLLREASGAVVGAATG